MRTIPRNLAHNDHNYTLEPYALASPPVVAGGHLPHMPFALGRQVGSIRQELLGMSFLQDIRRIPAGGSS